MNEEQSTAAIKPCLSVVTPVFNEEKTIEKVLRKVLRQKEVLEVIVVDDGSTDRTLKIAQNIKSPNVRILIHRQNLGKGRAMITGLRHSKGDYVIIQDADLEYDPNDYPKLLKPLIENQADFVIGTRWRSSHGYWFTLIANWLMTTLTNILFNTKTVDAYSGYKVGKRLVWDQLKIKSNGFEVEAEIVAKLGLLKSKIVDVPIRYKPRTYAQGKKIKITDAFKGAVKLLEIKFGGNR